jgi:predicted dehydrogenase
MKKIKVLLLGLGRIASILEKDPYRNKPCTHAGTIFSKWGKRHFTLSAIADQNPDRVNEFYNTWSSHFASKNPESLSIESGKISSDSILSNIDLAIIATSSDSHFENAKQMIQLGIPNLLIEKPVTLSLKKAKELERLSRKQNTRIWVNHERRYHPIYAWAREGLLAGRFGRVRTVRASVLTSALNPGIAFSGKGGGPLFHDGTHAVDFLHWLLGNPISIQAKFTKSNPKYKLEEQALVWLEYKDGVNVFLEVGGYRKYFQFEIDIQTSDSRIILGNDGFHFWNSKDSPLYKGFRSLVKEDSTIPDSMRKDSNPFPRLYKSIYQSIDKDLPVETGSIQDNVEILAVLEKIQNQANSKK